VEEGSLLRTLVFDCGHGYAQEDYAMKRRDEDMSYYSYKIELVGTRKCHIIVCMITTTTNISRGWKTTGIDMQQKKLHHCHPFLQCFDSVV